MSMDSKMVYVAQMDIAWEDKPANILQVRKMFDGIDVEPGSMLVVPEMFATGFTMEAAAMAETRDGATARFLSEFAKEKSAYVVGGLIAAGGDGRGRNQSVLFGPDGSRRGEYTKIQPFAPGGESERYEAGNEIELWDWDGIRVAPFICYDLRFPEIFRHAVLRGAEMFVVIASWPAARAAHWVSLLQARAIENQAYVVGVNRCGRDPKFEYPGRSMVIDPHGKIMVDAGDAAMGIRAEIAQEAVRECRERLPFLKDLRPEFLGVGDSAVSCHF